MVDFINKYGLLAILILIFLEYACFPLPSEILLPLAGGIAYKANISFVVLIISSTISAVLGSLLCYFIGAFGGNALLNMVLKKIPRLKNKIEITKDKYLKHATLSTFFSRLIPICRTYISFIAGIYKQNIVWYIISTLFGALIWNSILLGLGYYAIFNASSIKQIYNQYKIIILLVILGLLVISIIIKEVKHKKKSQ